MTCYYKHPLTRFQFGEINNLPEPDHGSLDTVVATRRGVYARKKERLVRVADAFDTADGKESSIGNEKEKLIRRALSGERDDRGKAARTIIRRGVGMIPALKKTLKAEDDPSTTLRIKWMMQSIRNQGGEQRGKQNGDGDASDAGSGDETDVRADKTSTADPHRWGRFRVVRVASLQQTRTGHVLIGVHAGRNVRADTDLPPGFLVVPPGDDPYYLPVERDASGDSDAGLRGQPLEGGPYRIGPNRYHVYTQKTSNIVVNLADRSMSFSGPDRPLATDGTGRRYAVLSSEGRNVTRLFSSYRRRKSVARRSSSSGRSVGDEKMRLGLIWPGQPDVRINPTDPVSMAVNENGTTLVAASRGGALYVVADGGGLVRVRDGDRLRIPAASELRGEDPLAIGRDETILFRHDDRWTLIGTEGEIDHFDSLKNVVEQRYQTIAWSFLGAGVRFEGTHPRLRLLADERGHVWVRLDGRIRVFAAGRWLDVVGGTAQKAPEQNVIRLLEPGPGSDERLVFLLTVSPDHHRGVYLAVEDGELSREPVPNLRSAPEADRFHDVPGTDWLPLTRSREGGDGGVFRIREPGRPGRMSRPGTSVVADGAGNVLYHHRAPNTDGPGVVRVLRDGRIAAEIRDKRLGKAVSLAAAGPGAIYAGSGRHVLLLTADEPSIHPERYRQSRWMALAEDHPGDRIERLVFFGDRFLGLVLRDGAERRLHIFRPPTTETGEPK